MWFRAPTLTHTSSVIILLLSASLLPQSGLATSYDIARSANLLLLLGATVKLVIHPPIWMSGKALIIISGYLTCGILSSAYAEYSFYAFGEVAVHAALIALTIGIWHEASSRTERAALVLWASLGAAGMILAVRFGASLLAAFIERDTGGLAETWLPFINPRYLAKVSTICVLALAAATTYRALKPAVRLLCFICAVALFIQNILDGNRGAVLSIAFGSIFASFIFGQRGLPQLIASAAVTATSFAVWAWIQHLLILIDPDFSNRPLTRTSLSNRDILWTNALEEWSEHPLLGIGPQHFAEYGRSIAAGQHNAVIQIASEWGAVALAASAIAAVLVTRKLIRGCRRTANDGNVDTSSQYFLCASLAAMVPHALVANILNDPISQIICASLLGCLLAYAAPPKNIHVPITTAARLIAAAVAAIIVVGVAMTGASGIRCMRTSTYEDFLAPPEKEHRVSPRTWSQGLIPLEKTCPKHEN